MEEVLPEGKNFKLLDDSELPEVLDFLSNYLPDSIKFHQTLKTHLNDRVWDFHFYVNKDWPKRPVILHFPGTTKTPNNKMYESFSVFCPYDELDNLELLKEEDILIDWTAPIYINFIHAHIMERIEEFYSTIGTTEKLIGEVMVQSGPWGEEEGSTEIEFADDAEILQLTPEHVDTIYDLYPAKHMECIEVFKRLVESLPSYGVFSQSGELAAWMIQSYYGAMISMQTKPEFRRKGYGLIVAKYLSKVVKDRGYMPFVVVLPENSASKGLYTKLGFKKHFDTVRAILHPNDMANDQQGGGEAS